MPTNKTQGKGQFFEKLKKYFSSSIVIKYEKGDKIHTFDIDSLQTIKNVESNRIIDTQGSIYQHFFEVGGNLSGIGFSTMRNDLYRNYELMDQDPVISTVLDVLAEECLGGQTIIPLLDGRKITIKELFESKETDFWLYGLDADGTFTPIQASKVVYNGKKQVYKLTLEDETELICTENHIWVSSDRNLIVTDKLQVSDGLYTLATKIGKIGSKEGYLKIINNGCFDFIHRLVARKYPLLLKQRKNKDAAAYIHHSSFNKNNNVPDQLEWVSKEEHLKKHAEFNRKLWNDEINAPLYKEKIREAKRKYWDIEENHIKASERAKIYVRKWINSLTSEQRKEIYGRKGEKNGAWGRDQKGEKNTHYNHTYKRAQHVNINDYELDVFKGLSTKQLCMKYELISYEARKLNKIICMKYGCARINNIIKLDKLVKIQNLNLSEIRLFFYELQEKYKHPLYHLHSLYKKFNITRDELTKLANLNGYKRIKDLMSNNHRIIKIEKLGYEDVYDIVNAGENHIFAIETKDGGKLYTHNCTTTNEYGELLSINSTKESISESLNNLFYDVLNIEFNLPWWVRNLVKYGDMFLKLDIVETVGVTNVIPLSAYGVERLEDTANPELVKFRYDESLGTSLISYTNRLVTKKEMENYEIAHFRLLSDSNYLPYGRSYLEGARKIWNQLTLMIDAMLIHRIVRAPEKRIFYTDIGNIAPNQVEAHMKKVADKMKRQPIIDERTGNYNLRYNLNSLLEDYYIGVRGDKSGSKIETLPGMSWTGTEDLEFLQDRMFAALKVPKGFLNAAESLGQKSSLAAQDLRFARTIERIQKVIVSELTKIAIIHLYTQGYAIEDIIDFEISMSSPSTIYENEKTELLKNKVDLTASMKELKLFSDKWIYNTIFDMSDEEAQEEEENIIYDLKKAFRHSQIETDGNDPAASMKLSAEDAEVEPEEGFDSSVDKSATEAEAEGESIPKEGPEAKSEVKPETEAKPEPPTKAGRNPEEGVKPLFSRPPQKKIIKVVPKKKEQPEIELYKRKKLRSATANEKIGGDWKQSINQKKPKTNLNNPLNYSPHGGSPLAREGSDYTKTFYSKLNRLNENDNGTYMDDNMIFEDF